MTLLPPVFTAFLSGLLRLAGRQMRRLRRDTGGNMMIIMGLSAVPLIFAVGFGIDYSRAQKMQTKLTAIADSAALLAVSPVYLGKTDDAAAAAAQAQFDAQAATLKGVTITSRSITAVTTSSGSLGGRRVATATYHATSTNMFGPLLAYFTRNANSLSLPIGGTVQADASQPPSINFYVVLDTSPSMLLPTSTSGLNVMVSAAKTFGLSSGCAFACHTQHPENDGITVKDSSGNQIFLATDYSTSGNYYRYYPITSTTGNVYDAKGNLLGTSGKGSYVCSNSSSTTSCTTYWTLTYQTAYTTTTTTTSRGKTTTTTTTSYTPTSFNVYRADSWWVARNYNAAFTSSSTSSVELRMDAETKAVQQLITTAQTTVSQLQSSRYSLAYKMQFYKFNYVAPTALSFTSSMTDVTSLSSSSVPDLGGQSEYLYSNNYWTTSSTSTSDTDTRMTQMLTNMNTTMPAPGDGLTTSNPQEVMFIVTDGLADEWLTGYTCYSSGRACTQLTTSQVGQCTTIKNRGIRIGILYTEYLGSTISLDSTGTSIANNNVPYIEQQLQSCASTNADGTKLYYKVSTDGDIASALSVLFNMAVQTAYLAK